MMCKLHPNCEIEFTEIVTITNHPSTDHKVKTYTDIPYCSDCFTQFEYTGKYTPQIIYTDTDYLESKADVLVENSIGVLS